MTATPFFRPVEARLLPLLPRLRRFRRDGRLEPPPGLRRGARPRQPDQGQRRDLADRRAQAAQQHQRARGLRRKHRRSHRSGRQGAGRRRHRRVAPAIDEGARRSRPRAGHALSSTRTGTSTIPTATHGSIPSAQRSSPRTTPASISERSAARRGLGLQFSSPAPGGLPSETFAERARSQAQRPVAQAQALCPAHTDSDISVHVRRSERRACRQIRSGTASIRSSTIRPAAASTA